MEQPLLPQIHPLMIARKKREEAKESQLKNVLAQMKDIDAAIAADLLVPLCVCVHTHTHTHTHTYTHTHTSFCARPLCLPSQAAKERDTAGKPRSSMDQESARI